MPPRVRGAMASPHTMAICMGCSRTPGFSRAWKRERGTERRLLSVACKRLLGADASQDQRFLLRLVPCYATNRGASSSFKHSARMVANSR